MKYDLQCQCGKGIRVLRGDLAEIPCADCGRNVPVSTALRAGLPAEYRPLGAWASATEAQGRFARLWKDSPVKVVCWSLAAGLALIPVFVKPTSDYFRRRALIRSESSMGDPGITEAPRPPDDPMETAWRRIASSGSLEEIQRFAADFPDARYREDVAGRAWVCVQGSGRLEDFDWYLDTFPTGAHAEEARGRQAELTGQAEAGKMQAELEALRAAPSLSGAQQFLRDHPASPDRVEVREIVFRELESRSTPGNEGDEGVVADDSPPVSVLRDLVAGGRLEVSASLSGFTHEDTGNIVFDALASRLADLGIKLNRSEGAEGEVRIVGSESIDTSRVYENNFPGGTAPSPENISVTIFLHPPGLSEAAWQTTISATSPDSVSYTYEVVDMGPSQGAVHSNTLSELSKAMESVLECK